MKKVLIISSSPRKNGNSDILCDQFMSGAIEAGNEVEKIRLAEIKMNFCLACGACSKSHRCVQKDDVRLILDKILESDVIVLATPIYFYSMCGQMKTLIDRTLPIYNTEKSANKEFYYIMTSADGKKEHLEKTVEAFRGFTLDCLQNPQEKGIIYGVSAWKKGDIKNTPAFEEAYTMGKNV